MRKRTLGFIAAAVLFVIVIVAVIVVVNRGEDSPTLGRYYTSCNGQHNNSLETYITAAVSTDGFHCSSIAKDVLAKGGNAGDAAVAALFCTGIINLQSAGLGGGFLATYYSKSEGKMYTLDSRETAPAAATKDMYMDPPKKGKWWDAMPSASYKGGLSVAVPGESAGLYEIYTKFGGKLPWRDLIEPSIKLCRDGFNISWYHVGIMQFVEKQIMAEPSMRDILMKNEKFLEEGELLKRPLLAKTLEALQDNPFELINGTLAKKLADDIKSYDGIVTFEDISNYRPKWRNPIKVELQNKDYSLYSFPPPGSGLIVGLILNILDEYKFNASSIKSKEEVILTYHRIVEAFKHSYGHRSLLGDLPDAQIEKVIKELTEEKLAQTILSKISDVRTESDPKFYGAEVIPKGDQGTAQISIISPNGDAVSITTSINFAFGAGIRSVNTGVILNNQMADFVTDISNPDDPSYNENNLIVPGHRPLSSMSPTIILDQKGETRLVIGAAGGMRIPTAIAWVSARSLWFDEDMKRAVDACRLHHQLDPMFIQHELGFPENIMEGLKKMGHEIKQMRWKSIVGAISRKRDGKLETTYDFRKSGEVSGL